MISFATPLALLSLLALAPATAAAAHLATRRRAADATLGGADLLRRGRSSSRRRLRTALLLAAIALIALALARPRWGDAEQPLTRRGIDVAIALDVSRSMTATDVAPDRASAAASGLRDMLDHLRGDRVGLVTFAGDAFVRSPLTLDLEVIRQLVAQAQGESELVRPGTNLNRALQASMDLLAIEDQASTQVIVLVSDGEDLRRGNSDPALRRARNADIRVYAIAVGTERGVDIPADSAGSTQTSRLNRELLAQITADTGGNLRDTDAIVGLAVEFASLRQSEFVAMERAAQVERFQWFLAAALLLLLAHSAVTEGGRTASLRRGPISLGAASLPAALLSGLLFIGCGGSAAYRHVSAGTDAYEAGRYDQALDSYRRASELAPDDAAITYDIGNALHGLRRFEEAAAASTSAAAQTDDARLLQHATYAIGNHAFRRDALKEAREAFISVLLRDPDDDDARHNLELVLQALAPPPTEESKFAPFSGDPGEGEQNHGGAGDLEGEQQDNGSTAPLQKQESDSPADGDIADNAENGGPGTGGGAVTLYEAQQELEAALLSFGEELTLEEALEILDLVRRVNALASRELSLPAAGPLPPR